MKARLLLCLWALLCSNVWARPTLEQIQAFIAKLELRQQAGDVRGILRQSGQDPEMSAVVIHDWPLEMSQMSGERWTARRRLLTLVARGLDLVGHPEPLQSLRQANLASAAEAGENLQTAVAVDVSARLEGIDWNYWGIPNLARTLDLGNYRQYGQLSEAYRAYLEEAQGSESARARLALAESNLLAGEFPHSEDRRQQMLEWAATDTSGEETAFLSALLLVVASESGRPDVARQLLEPLQAALRQAPPDQQPLYRFLLETYRFRLMLRNRSSPDFSEALKHHKLAWEAFASYHGSRSRQTRLWLKAADFWTQFLDHSINAWVQPDALRKLALADLEQIFRVSGEALQQDSYAAQLGTLASVLERELENLRVETRRLDQSRPLLDLTTSTLETYRGWLSEDQLTQDLSCPASIRRRLGADFHLDLLHGDWSLVESRRLALQQLHDRDESKIPALIQASADAARNHGLLGFQDARYLLLQHLVRSPHEEALLQSLESEWSVCQFRPGLIALTLERGERLARSGQVGEAMVKLQLGFEQLEKYLGDFGGGLALVTVYRTSYELLARLQTQSGMEDAAFDTLARLNNAEALARSTAALLQRPEFAELRKLSEQAEVLQQRLASQQSLGRKAQESSELLAQNRQQAQQLLEDVLRRTPQYRQALSLTPIDLTRSQKFLPKDTVLVQYLPGPQGLYLFVLSADGLKVRRVNVPQEELHRAVGRVRARIISFAVHPELIQHFSWTRSQAPGFAQHTVPLIADSRKLYDWLIKPLEQDLRGHSVLAIIPSGNLYYVPFASLISKMTPKGPRFVVHQWQTVEMVRAADLRRLSERLPGRKGGLLALANPDGSLPGAELEVRHIARSFAKARVHFGSRAQTALLSSLPPGTRFLHLATHGVLDGRQPLESYLVMAGQTRLRIRDVYALSFRQLRLVTLSACRTALQEGGDGAEVTSLAQAFSVAGGRAVLASLWDVSDDGTERLMSALYPQLARGHSLSRSLQQAQLQVLAQPGFEHPFYWAAFSLFGDWR